MSALVLPTADFVRLGYLMHRGYIKVFRKIFDSEIWEEKPFSRGQAWIDLVLLANHKKGYFRVRGVRVDVERGQVGTSSKTLASRWGWSRGKVLRFLHELETVQQIVQQKNNVSSLISIINYEQYQGDGTADSTANGTQTGCKRDANGTQTDTNKKDKKDKNDKKKEREKTPLPKKQIKKDKHGTFGNVLLSGEEFETLKISLGEKLQDRIDSLSEYIESNGKRYKSHYATIISWARRDQLITKSITEIKRQWKDDQEWKKRRDMRLRAVK